MPVDKALLDSCIAEAAGDDAEMATFLRDRYAKNDALAAKFVGRWPGGAPLVLSPGGDDPALANRNC